MKSLFFSPGAWALLALLAVGCGDGESDALGTSVPSGQGGGSSGQGGGSSGQGGGSSGQGGGSSGQGGGSSGQGGASGLGGAAGQGGAAGLGGGPARFFRVVGGDSGNFQCGSTDDLTIQLQPAAGNTYSAVVWPKFATDATVLSDLKVINDWKPLSANQARPALASSATSEKAFLLGPDGQPNAYTYSYSGPIPPNQNAGQPCRFEGPLVPDDEAPTFQFKAGPFPWSQIWLQASEGLVVEQAKLTITAGGVPLPLIPFTNEGTPLVATWKGVVLDWTQALGASVQGSFATGLSDPAGNKGAAFSGSAQLVSIGPAAGKHVFGPDFKGYEASSVTALPAGSASCAEGCLRVGSKLSSGELVAGQLTTTGKSKVTMRYRLPTPPDCNDGFDLRLILQGDQSFSYPGLVATGDQVGEETLDLPPGTDLVAFELSYFQGGNSNSNVPCTPFELTLLSIEAL